jgi:hypothetical protein
MFLSPDDLRILTGRAHKPLEKETNSKEAFTQWLEEWVSPDHLSPSVLAERAWQASLEWAAKGQEPVAWYTQWENGEWSVYDKPNYGVKSFPLYLHPAPIREGWKWVPIEPTEEMLNAGRWSGAGDVSVAESWARMEIWRRMVFAAPEDKE